MLRRIVFASSAALLLAVPASTVVAQPFQLIPGLSLSFVTPFDVGTTTSVFDVFIRITNNTGSDFDFNGHASAENPGGPDHFGLPGTFPYPSSGNIQGCDPNNPPGTDCSAAFSGDYTSAFLNNPFECTGTFTNSCGPGAYAFDFNFAAPSLVGLETLDIPDNSSADFLFGTFTPTGGSAAPGLYTFYNAELTVDFEGQDANGDNIDSSVTVARTCDGQGADPTCQFSRLVVGGPTSAPEPATFVLLGTGLAAMGIVRRRRRKNMQ